MGKSKQKKQKLSITPNPTPAKPVKKLKKQKKKTPSQKSISKPESILKLLNPYSKEQLTDLVIDSALLNPTLVAKIQDFADIDVPHREIFVYGLSRSSTNESLAAEFSKFGEIENCHVVLDKATGKAKGFAFIVFKSRKSALKALKQPKMMVDNRFVSCQLASLGRPSGSMNQNGNVVANASARKIFVSNVMSDVNPEKLKKFFSSFGEIEGGPYGFDPNTGKFRGYALFVYVTLEGAKKVLEEPNKVFEGRQLLCRKALDGEKAYGGATGPGITTSVQAVPPVYAASASVQNMGLLAPNPNEASARGQNMGLLTPYPNARVNGGLLVQNPNAGVNGGFLSQNPNDSGNGGMMGLNALHAARFYRNPNAAAGMINVNPYGEHGRLSAGGMPMGMGMGMGGYNGMLGNYGLGSPATMSGLGGGAGSSSSQPMMQGYLNAYPSTLNAPNTSYAGNPAVRPYR